MTRGEIPFGFASKVLTKQFAFVVRRRLCPASLREKEIGKRH